MAVTALLLGWRILATSAEAHASSHREVPFVTKNPKVDGTAFCLFHSYEAGRTGYVTLIADYLETPNPGPQGDGT